MLTITATKPRLYLLVSQYTTLPPIKETEFRKAYRRPDFYLNWSGRDMKAYTASLFAVAGEPVLVIEGKGWEGNMSSRRQNKLSIQELKRRGMVKEVLKK